MNFLKNVFLAILMGPPHMFQRGRDREQIHNGETQFCKNFILGKFIMNDFLVWSFYWD